VTAARPDGGSTESAGLIVVGRLVLEDRVVPGRIDVEAGRIRSIVPDERAEAMPYVCPGFVDIHVHGWGGHDAMGGRTALDGMARALLQHGVTSFLPTAETAAPEVLGRFADDVRCWSPTVGGDRSEPLGFNLEGPFISPVRVGAQNPAFVRAPCEADRVWLAPLLEGLKIITVAPELDGATDLIRWLVEAGVKVSLGHSDANADQAIAGYRAGARCTTHVLNAMSGLDHHAPGLAAIALRSDDAYVELIADGLHVDPRLWKVIVRSKPVARLLLVSDAISLAGVGDGRAVLNGVEVEVRDGRCTLAGDDRLAGSVIALDTAVRNLVREGVSLPAASRAASGNPANLLGVTDRGRIAQGLVADLVELDDDLRVQRVMKRGRWYGHTGAVASVAQRADGSSPRSLSVAVAIDASVSHITEVPMSEQYFDVLDGILCRAREINRDAIPAAGKLIADAVGADGIVHVFGSGHSQLIAMDLADRAGGLAAFDVIFDPSYGRAETIEGYAATLLRDHVLQHEDCLIVISNSGRNPSPVEMAMTGRAGGLAVIAVTAADFSRSVQPRHSSGHRLLDVADVVLDTCGTSGDASVSLDGLASAVGPTSTVVGAALLNAVVVEAAAELLRRGIEPPVYASQNVDGSGSHNAALDVRYVGRTRRLP
jgi:N-acetylglucosamine-6-phosphate deacetylase